MRKRISAFSVVFLSGVVLALANWSMMFQPSATENLHQVINQQQNRAVDSVDSNVSSAGVSSQHTPAPNPSVSSSSLSKAEPAQNHQGYAQLVGPIPEVVWAVPTASKVVFITVDDGWYPSEPLLDIMRKQHVPISAFLIEKAAQEHPDFWRAFLAAGGDIENHTFSHPDLTKESPQNIASQIETAQKYLSIYYSAPALLRPPYGSYNQTVCRTTLQAGIKHIVLWNATMSNAGLQTYNGKPLEPGSIVLLHWVPDLAAQIQKLLVILNQEHFGVASLPYALDHPDKFPVIWPLAQAED